LSRVEEEFDFSDYPKDHILFSGKNKKVIGKMKDEANGKLLESFVGLAPKLYSFSGQSIQKAAAKGVKRSLMRRQLKHNMFLNALFAEKKLMCQMNLIRSKSHRITTSTLTKVALHCFDSKRYILRNGIKTLAHNSCRIKRH
jgi:hypothetical protein